MAALDDEVRTRRLVAVDDRNEEPIVGEIVGGTGELSVDLPGRRLGRWSSVFRFANPGDAERSCSRPGWRAAWVDGDAVDEFATWLGVDQ